MKLPPLNDTIAAVATPPGVGAIGIVRVSGPQSFDIADAIFEVKHGVRPSRGRAGRIRYGTIHGDDEVIDEALLLPFRKPNSYTTQDLIELHTHGGPAVVRAVLNLCLGHGARPAQPGEFTLRAFLHGRLDLVQAEAVLDLVNAQSDTARRSAALGLGKALSRELDLIQTDITGVLGNIQAVIDYPEEGVPETELAAPLQRALDKVERLLATAQAGSIARRGAKLALVGRPNAGKSSLLNALLGYQRSIVAASPGTTRDYLEAPLELGGVPITAIDTAGIRETKDDVEATGVSAAQEIARQADLTLVLLDRSEPLNSADLELTVELDPKRTLIVGSKADLAPAWRESGTEQEPLAVSAVTGEGMEQLRQAIRERLIGDAGASELWITSERHAEALKQVRELIRGALRAPDDLAALDLESALRTLGEITGRHEVAEETLAHIFSKFCVGK